MGRLVKRREKLHEGGMGKVETSQRSGPPLYIPPIPPPCPYPPLCNQGGKTPAEPEDEPECPGGPGGGGGAGW